MRLLMTVAAILAIGTQAAQAQPSGGDRFGRVNDEGWDLGPPVTVALVARVVAAESPRVDGPFEPTWESLRANYKVPDWFRDAKFGLSMQWGLYSIPENQQAVLRAIGKWLSINGEAICGTRPWTRDAEGDFRFTTQGDTLYAISLRWPGKATTITSLGKRTKDLRGVLQVKLLGDDRELPFVQDADGLHVTMPDEQVGEMPLHCGSARVYGSRGRLGAKPQAGGNVVLALRYRSGGLPIRRRNRPIWPAWSISCGAHHSTAPSFVVNAGWGRSTGTSSSASVRWANSLIACWWTASNTRRISSIGGYWDRSATGREPSLNSSMKLSEMSVWSVSRRSRMRRRQRLYWATARCPTCQAMCVVNSPGCQNQSSADKSSRNRLVYCRANLIRSIADSRFEAGHMAGSSLSL